MACATAAGGSASRDCVRRRAVSSGGHRRISQGNLALVFLSCAYGGILFQQPTLSALCLDVGRKHAGAVFGFMNTASNAASALSAVVFGYMVGYFGDYNAPFVPMVALLSLGAALWLQVDATRDLLPDQRPAESPHRTRFRIEPGLANDWWAPIRIGERGATCGDTSLSKTSAKSCMSLPVLETHLEALSCDQDRLLSIPLPVGVHDLVNAAVRLWRMVEHDFHHLRTFHRDGVATRENAIVRSHRPPSVRSGIEA